MNPLLKYYSIKDIQQEIIRLSKNREIAAVFSDKGFGKRPDILQYEQDILELVKKGATSFHISEEHWTNPLLLKPGMTKSELDRLRTGFDLILDIDGPFEYSQIAAYLIVEALKYHNIENISVKFSGNKGFHIGIPFSSFPEKVNNIDTRLLFPDAPKIISQYLKEFIKEQLIKKTEKKDPFSIVDIDTVLISNRHMFRSVYSYHEKSGLISIPIDPDSILNFKKEQAKIENVKTDIQYLKESSKPEASQLIIQAFDFQKKHENVEIKTKIFELPTKAIHQRYFPPCLLKGLGGLQDGKKRFLFILINFLKSLGYNHQEIILIVQEWNKKNNPPLRENYIIGQLNYNKNSKPIMPPNCSNESYYKSLGICCPDNLCKLVKNPVNYALRKSRFKEEKIKINVKKSKNEL